MPAARMTAAGQTSCYVEATLPTSYGICSARQSTMFETNIAVLSEWEIVCVYELFYVLMFNFYLGRRRVAVALRCFCSVPLVILL